MGHHHHHHAAQPKPPALAGRRRFTRPALAAGWLLAACATTALAAPEPCKIQVIEMPVAMVGLRAIATVGLNGAQAPLVVDTGAFFSFLTDGAAAQLKLPVHPAPYGLRVNGLTGPVSTRMTTVAKMSVLKADIPNVDFLVGGNDLGADALGVLGRNLLAMTDTEYDLPHGMIRFAFPKGDCDHTDMAYWAGDTPVSELDLESSRGQDTPSIRTKVKLNDKTLTALFDTGATTFVTLDAAKDAGLKTSDLQAAGTVHGAGRGSVESWTAPFEKFELGGEIVQHNHLGVADISIGEHVDMLLGIDFFLSHRIFVSKTQSKMYFTYTGGPVFARNTGAAASAPPFDDDAGAATVSADQFARRGAAAASRQDYAGALADLDRACELEPTSAAFFSERGHIQLALKHTALALADFDTALRLDPGATEARLQRAWLQSATHADAALADLSTLDKTLPAQAPMRLAMARLYQQLLEPSQVVAQLDLWVAAHKHDVNLDEVKSSRCWARVQLGIDLDKALEDCDEAVGTQAKNADFIDRRAWVYLRMGQFQKALADFDRSIELRPQGTLSLYGRGLTHLKMGDAARGAADLEAARKSDPNIDVNVQRLGLRA